MTTEFDILHALRVKGLATPEILSALSGIAPADLEAACAPLVDAGLALARTGRMAGYLLTPTGKAEADRLLGDDGTTQAARPALETFDEEFLPVNSEFKQICHRWQVGPDGQPNTHADAEHDASVVAQLRELHTRVVPTVEALGAALPRFARYVPRLAGALERVEAGDATAFARPMNDSYHDVWMELHQDVVLSLGRERGRADEH